MGVMSTLTPEQRTRVIDYALSGEHIYGLLPGHDPESTIRHAIQGMHSWQGPSFAGRVMAKGIEVAVEGGIETITWQEVVDVIRRGATRERAVAYMEAHQAFSEWAMAGGYSRSTPAMPKDEAGKAQWRADRDAEHAEWSRVHNALRQTTTAILQAGCSLEPVQTTLW
jgi:hypothetical protein